MSSTIEYIDITIVCPKCNQKNEVMLIKEQNNRTCEINTCLAHNYKCIECGYKLNYYKE